MRKITITDNGDCYLESTLLGKAKIYYNGTLTIKGEKNEIIATRGSIDKNGNFIPFCTKTNCNKCKSRKKPGCRYGIRYGEGYFIN